MKEKRLRTGSCQTPAELGTWSCHVQIGLDLALHLLGQWTGIASEALRKSINFEINKFKNKLKIC